MALDKELNKRERLLQTMVKLNQAGMGLSLEMIEKLREERNMLPLYRRKAQDLQQQIDEREKDQKAMKRDPFFTRVIELQIEYVSWKQEASRLESLMSEPSPEANPVARQEIDVHSRRLDQLKQDLAAAQRKRQQVKDELQDMQEEHADCQRHFQEKKDALTREQEATRDIAVSFKQMLQDRKEAERLQAEIEEMAAARKQHEQELAVLLRHQAAEDAKSTQSPTGASPPVLTREMEQGLMFLKKALRREATPSLSESLRSADHDEDGQVTMAEIEEAMTKWQGCPIDSAEAAMIVFALCNKAGQAAERIRWPMVLDTLQRGGSELAMQSQVQLPPLRPLRWACLRSRMASEELSRQIQAISSFPEARLLFGGSLALADADVAGWVEAWQHLGSKELHARIPLEQAAMSHAALSAWSGRVRAAVAQHREELSKSFAVWRADMQLTQEQFRLICSRELEHDLSSEDVEDLLLFSLPSFPVDDHQEVIDGSSLLQQFGG